MSLHDKVFKAAKKDKLFREEFCSLPSCTFPRFFADNIEKGVWSAGYYGWLIGKYGTEIGQQMYENIKYG